MDVDMPNIKKPKKSKNLNLVSKNLVFFSPGIPRAWLALPF